MNSQIGAWKWNFPPLLGNYARLTVRPTNQQTDRPTYPEDNKVMITVCMQQETNLCSLQDASFKKALKLIFSHFNLIINSLSVSGLKKINQEMGVILVNPESACIYLFISLSIIHIYLSTYLSIFLSTYIYISFRLSIFLHIYLSIYFNICI